MLEMLLGILMEISNGGIIGTVMAMILTASAVGSISMIVALFLSTLFNHIEEHAYM